VQKELRGWGDNGDDDDGLDQNMEACENMLRGCIGLDVTAFVLMTLVRVLEVITELQSLLSSNENDGSREENNTNNDECVSSLIHTKQQERLLFDVFRLTSVLRDVVLVTEPNLLQLRNRLKAVLQNDKISNNVEMIVMDVIYWVQ
jgi:broad-specificity NMP kinase